jgi:hypothetical protein
MATVLESVSGSTETAKQGRKRMDDDAIEQMTFKYFPEPVVGNLLRSVFTARRLAWEHCGQQFPEAEARNLRPYYARAHVEQLMRGVADRHGSIKSEVVKQEGQPWNHTELTNGPVLMTAATVQRPAELVDLSQYRRALARSPQVQLDSLEDPQPKDGILYTLLLHSRSYWPDARQERDYGFLPGSVYLAYPNSELTYYRRTINLFDRFPEIVKAMTPEEWDTQTFTLYVERSRVVPLPRRMKG